MKSDCVDNKNFMDGRSSMQGVALHTGIQAAIQQNGRLEIYYVNMRSVTNNLVHHEIMAGQIRI